MKVLLVGQTSLGVRPPFSFCAGEIRQIRLAWLVAHRKCAMKNMEVIQGTGYKVHLSESLNVPKLVIELNLKRVNMGITETMGRRRL